MRENEVRLEDILHGKRESRMGYEHSEDAVTWNAFRFFERNDCIAPAIRTICPCPESEPLTVLLDNPRQMPVGTLPTLLRSNS